VGHAGPQLLSTTVERCLETRMVMDPFTHGLPRDVYQLRRVRNRLATGKQVYGRFLIWTQRPRFNVGLCRVVSSLRHIASQNVSPPACKTREFLSVTRRPLSGRIALKIAYPPQGEGLIAVTTALALASGVPRPRYGHHVLVHRAVPTSHQPCTGLS